MRVQSGSELSIPGGFIASGYRYTHTATGTCVCVLRFAAKTGTRSALHPTFARATRRAAPKQSLQPAHRGRNLDFRASMPRVCPAAPWAVGVVRGHPCRAGRAPQPARGRLSRRWFVETGRCSERLRRVVQRAFAQVYSLSNCGNKKFAYDSRSHSRTHLLYSSSSISVSEGGK